jgi:predicted TIM-barrel fold metal-dependent hydrolase
MRLADAHVHLFSRDDLAAYERLRAPAGVEAALVVGYEGQPAHRGNNDLVLELADARPQLAPLAFVPVATPDPDRIAGLGRRGFHGISLYVTDQLAAGQLARWSAAAVAAVATYCRIVSVNVRAHLVPQVVGVLAGFAPATVLLSHLGLPGRFATVPAADQVAAAVGPVLAVAEHEHIGVKLSAYYATTEPRHRYPHDPARPFVDALLERFGPRRAYWGSDFPPALGFVSFAQAVDCYLPQALSGEDREAVMGGNLLALLATADRDHHGDCLHNV